MKFHKDISVPFSWEMTLKTSNWFMKRVQNEISSLSANWILFYNVSIMFQSFRENSIILREE